MGGSIIFTHGCSNSRGVAILISNRFNGKILEINPAMDGRKLIIRVEIDSVVFAIMCLYAPNVDNPNFFVDAFNEILKLECDQYVIGGDYNLVLNSELDSYNLKTNHVKSAQMIQDFMQNEGFCNVYRTLHNDDKRFTYFRKNPLVGARLDMFLIPIGLMDMVESVQILGNTLSDHSLIEMKLSLSNFKCGPGLWKLNNSLLDIPELRHEITSAINEFKVTHMHLDCYEWWEEMKQMVQNLF